MKLRRVVGLFALVLCAAAVLVAHVWKQNACVRLVKESMKLERECGRLKSGIALLELETGSLRRMSRIESIAREKFGLVYGSQPTPLYPEGDGSSGRTAWRISGL